MRIPGLFTALLGGRLSVAKRTSDECRLYCRAVLAPSGSCSELPIGEIRRVSVAGDKEFAKQGYASPEEEIAGLRPHDEAVVQQMQRIQLGFPVMAGDPLPTGRRIAQVRLCCGLKHYPLPIWKFNLYRNIVIDVIFMKLYDRSNSTH